MNTLFTGSGKNSVKSKAMELIMKQIKKGGKPDFNDKELYKKLLKAKLEEAEAQVMKKKSDRLSDSTKKALAQLKDLKEQREALAEMREVVVKPRKYSNGGRITDKGKILNNQGSQVGEIDLKTGNIKNKLGMSIGRYKESIFVHAKIAKMIEKNNPKKPAVPAAGFFGLGSAKPSKGPLNIYSTFGSQKSSGPLNVHSTMGEGYTWGSTFTPKKDE